MGTREREIEGGKRRVREGHIVRLVEMRILLDCFWEQEGPWGHVN